MPSSLCVTKVRFAVILCLGGRSAAIEERPRTIAAEGEVLDQVHPLIRLRASVVHRRDSLKCLPPCVVLSVKAQMMPRRSVDRFENPLTSLTSGSFVIDLRIAMVEKYTTPRERAPAGLAMLIFPQQYSGLMNPRKVARATHKTFNS